MLEQLFNLVQGEAHQDIINNPAIPNEHNNSAVGLATESIFNGLQSTVASGGIGQLLSLFGGKSSTGMSNPIVSGIANNLVGSLMGKLGINNSVATGIASSLIPTVLSKLVGQTADPNNSGFNMNGIIGSLMGGNHAQTAPPAQAGGLDFNNILQSLTGGGAPAQQAAANDDGFGMDDILKMVSGGGGQAAQSGGGIQDILKMVTNGAQSHQQQQQAQGGGVMDLLKGFMGS
jgi:hypothetical protein